MIFLATGEYATVPEDDPERPSPSSEELVRQFNETDRTFKERIARHEATGRDGTAGDS